MANIPEKISDAQSQISSSDTNYSDVLKGPKEFRKIMQEARNEDKVEELNKIKEQILQEE